jgi:hypothetical protein
MTNINPINTKLGRINENLITALFEEKGYDVVKSTDKFDSRKDILINGEEVELKLQTMYYFFKSPGMKYAENAFSVPITEDDVKIHTNQLSKCMNVDRLIFTQIPSRKYNEETINIYEAPPLGKRYFSILQNKKDKRYVAGFLLKDMKLIHQITNSTLVEYFRENGTSYF